MFISAKNFYRKELYGCRKIKNKEKVKNEKQI